MITVKSPNLGYASKKLLLQLFDDVKSRYKPDVSINITDFPTYFGVEVYRPNKIGIDFKEFNEKLSCFLFMQIEELTKIYIEINDSQIPLFNKIYQHHLVFKFEFNKLIYSYLLDTNDYRLLDDIWFNISNSDLNLKFNNFVNERMTK